MIGLRPGLQAFRLRAAFDGPTVYEAATLGELPPANEVAPDTVAFVGSAPNTDIYRSTGSVWLPERVLVSSSGALPSSAAEGALALVGTGTPLNTRIGWVRESGAWTELPAPPRVLSSYTSVLATDVDGDWGIFVHPATSEISMRRLRTITIAAGAGGGTVRLWVPPIVFAASSPRVIAYIVGTETAPANGVALRGYTYQRTGSATIASASSYMRFAAPAPGSGNQFAYAESPDITGAQRYYVMATMRGSAVGGVGAAGFYNSAAVQQSQWSTIQDNTIGAYLQPVKWSGSGWQASLPVVDAIDQGGLALNAVTPVLLEAIASNASINANMTTMINGRVYTAHRRSHDAATVSTLMRLIPFAGGNSTGASSGIFDVQDHYFMTLD